MTGENEAGAQAPAGMLLLCLLPVRNAEADLPGFLESVGRFCDGVLALDDGSTDATYDILAASPLVKRTLRNPVREDYRAWNDATNRNRLLTAAAAFEPEWIISIDADERLDEVDGRSLRRFLETDALPGFAFGFRHVPMRGDDQHFWPKYEWVYRLFSYQPGLRFPSQKLHFIPIPTAIPRERWLKTTLRIQHLGGMTAERRVARFEKYLEADPRRTYQATYRHLLNAPADADIRRWQSRPETMPVLIGDEQANTLPDGDGAPPAISAIIIAQNDEATIATSVASVVSQEVPEPFEVIVVTSGSDRTAELVDQLFPMVTHVALDKPALPGEARNAGLAVARGAFVSFPGSHVELRPGSLAARLRAHRRGYAMVTGITENGNETPAGWASYFLDHAEGLPGHPVAELNGPPAHCSYARLPLLEAGGFPDGVRTGEDTAVNRALVRRGYVALRDPAIRFAHRSPCTTPAELVRHHFKRGRGWGRLLVADHRDTGGLLNRDLLRSRLIEHLPKRLGRIRENVANADPALAEPFQAVYPLVIAGAVASLAGQWWEVLQPGPGKLEILTGKPVINLLVGITDEEPRTLLAQIDFVTGRVTPKDVPQDLTLHLGDDRPMSLAGAVTLARSAADAAVSAESLRQAAAETLDIPDVELLIGELDGLADGFAPATSQRLRSSGSVSTAERWASAMVRARQGRLLTTLSPVQLYRLVSTVE